ncbi:MAG: NADH-quinone oxidoreductase subunit C [Coriobacteriia bacterium]|jgi:NADH:ubiquinone oxidoreductase subunit C|nr:NADH-quinone oxidoreductase subunit C [Coriobacteriia bacterium]
MLPDKTVVNSALGAIAGGAEVTETTLGVVARVAASEAPAALAILKAEPLDFVMLVDMLGTDTGEDIEVTYHLRSFSRDEDLYVKCVLPYDGVLNSVWTVYPSALLPERETAELLGLTLARHPNPKRLLTTEGTPPLLRRSQVIRTIEEVRDR